MLVHERTDLDYQVFDKKLTVAVLFCCGRHSIRVGIRSEGLVGLANGQFRTITHRVGWISAPIFSSKTGGGGGADNEKWRRCFRKIVVTRSFHKPHRLAFAPLPVVEKKVGIETHPSGVSAMSAWLVKTRRAPSRHGGDARVYGHTTTAMQRLRTPPSCLAPLTKKGWIRKYFWSPLGVLMSLGRKNRLTVNVKTTNTCLAVLAEELHRWTTIVVYIRVYVPRI